MPAHGFPTAEGPFVPEIDCAELAALVGGRRPPTLLDVRPRPERAIARLPDDRWIPLEQLPARASELPRDVPIVVYCHHGGTSRRAVELLLRAGRSEVALLSGGIDDYARLVDPTIPRYASDPSVGRVLQQFPNVSTGCLAYLLYDRSSREAVIVDPGREVAPYLQALRRRRLRLAAIVETHTHADHLSGHARLHLRTDAPIYVGTRSEAQYPHRTLSEDEAIPYGRAELTVLETPGHTLDHLSLRSDGAVLTGDTLLPGSCGRADLGTGDVDLLWASLTEKLLRLPDDTEVFPAHYGAIHGLPPPERYSTTIGFERRTNDALRDTTRDGFRAYMTDGWPPKPASFDRIITTNLTE